MTSGVGENQARPYKSKSPSYLSGFLSGLSQVPKEMPVTLWIYE
jgi:hypothetical protein